MSKSWFLIPSMLCFWVSSWAVVPFLALPLILASELSTLRIFSSSSLRHSPWMPHRGWAESHLFLAILLPLLCSLALQGGLLSSSCPHPNLDFFISIKSSQDLIVSIFFMSLNTILSFLHQTCPSLDQYHISGGRRQSCHAEDLSSCLVPLPHCRMLGPSTNLIKIVSGC